MTLPTPWPGPQWSPIMKTGKTADVEKHAKSAGQPQWSPIMKTGKTTGSASHVASGRRSRNGARS